MARFKNGILGAFFGTVGTVVGYELNGDAIMRSKPGKKRGKPTKLELANRAWFKELQLWLKPIKVFLRVGFKNYDPKFQGFVAAKSYNKDASIGTYPNVKVDPAKVLVSYGTIEPLQEAQIEVDDNNVVSFKWTFVSYKSTDKVMILLYDVAAGKAIMDVSAASVFAGKYDWDLSGSKLTGEFQAYIAVVNMVDETQSNSVYLGAVTLQ
ncbi:MAG: hypothetical protein EOO92_23540 [Pedobacter sp.]|nr:MAG: hypothetical protein EOO92_23540 [Pedobacter sp.]